MDPGMASCAGPLRKHAPPVQAAGPAAQQQEEREAAMTVQVGKPAPEFEVNAFIDGTFGVVKLSDYKGKWVVLCFYPGDFTFV